MQTRAQEQARITLLVSNKEDFKPKLMRRDREGHYMLAISIIQQEEIIYALNFSIPNCVKQKFLYLKGQTDTNKTIAWDDFNSSHK